MGVYIKGMEMPKDRQLCIGIDEGYIFYKHPSENEWHMSDDSLIEIPPHGRLIDADALKMAWDGIEENMHTPVAVIRALIDDAPTIIDAEE